MKQLSNKDLPHIQSKEDLMRVFSLLKIHFDSNPKMYTRNDFMLLINSLYASIIYASNCGPVNPNEGRISDFNFDFNNDFGN